MGFMQEDGIVPWSKLDERLDIAEASRLNE